MSRLDTKPNSFCRRPPKTRALGRPLGHLRLSEGGPQASSGTPLTAFIPTRLSDEEGQQFYTQVHTHTHTSKQTLYEV